MEKRKGKKGKSSFCCEGPTESDGGKKKSASCSCLNVGGMPLIRLKRKRGEERGKRCAAT